MVAHEEAGAAERAAELARGQAEVELIEAEKAAYAEGLLSLAMEGATSGLEGGLASSGEEFPPPPTEQTRAADDPQKRE